MSAFGMSSQGQNARSQLNGIAGQVLGWGNQAQQNSAEQYTKGNFYGDSVYGAAVIST